MGNPTRAVMSLVIIVATHTTLAIDTQAQSAQQQRPAVVEVTPADGSADGIIVGTVDIPTTRARVWQVLIDCAQAPRIMVNLQRCEVLQSAVAAPGREPAWDIRVHQIAWTAVLPAVRSVFKSTYVDKTSIRFERASGSDLTDLEGEWRLEPLHQGAWTRLTYRARFGFHPLVPSFMIRQSMAADFPHFLEKIRTEAVKLQ